jgi:hypothetical protein
MITTLLFLGLIVLAIQLVYYYVSEKRKDKRVYLEDVGVGLFWISAVGVIILALNFPVSDSWRVETHRTDCVSHIRTLTLHSSDNGSFFLGTGTIKGKEYYYSYAKTERGTYVRVQLPTKSVELVLDDIRSPQMQWQEIQYRQSYWWSFIPVSSTSRTKYDIIVPTSTIIQKFEVQ